MAIPANAKYKTTAVQEYLTTATNNYYWVLAHNESADDAGEPEDEMKYDESFGPVLDDAEEPANETKYDESFGVNFLG